MSTESNTNRNAVRLEPWGKGDLPLLKQLLGDPAMMHYLGGPESEEKLIKRQATYEQMSKPEEGRMYKIVLEDTGEAVGSVGYWESVHNGEAIYETGWLVLPGFQGRGIASAAVALAIAHARKAGKHRYLHAFPSVENHASNALCRKAGFTLIEECDFEYPKGSFMRCNDWRLDLLASD
ncbi:RimJ/RimL family protein N-acetyltransferase [Thermosporothrix hazakensis]|jgi:RimJ/RimL family protein N-acetyltransferase|uniref:RimJ/RimL family protein N-acetyltransferase n=2 Tax=Thermosporothrix TaxID=768650 RepID=A0A326UA98_THEHA|nr:GNAT family N-acetyltransferase [Thermosporothrix hazakensis]PZW31293.1 RimJ/RimL family protein N-acetyltransferase [Thermosporothrix hazakensis]BBH86474.1 N-acetyltransferase GCN5 [Thermosporothrix sp. COM3]GCE50795.1 N-acetyltransferase GCN5 [Thermosporothrix hazakensis]